jgi:VWFA-related protein
LDQFQQQGREFMKNLIRFAFFVLLTALLLAPAPKAAKLLAEDQPKGGNDVIIDFVARDKKGAAITDLKESDIEVTEDGTKQNITSLRLVNPAAVPGNASDPLQKVKLVTMLFEQMQRSPEAQKVALQAVQNFMANGLDQNVMVGLFTLDKRLNLVMQYTNKKDVILATVKKAVGSSQQELQASSDALLKGLAGVANGMAAPEGKPEFGGTDDKQLDARLAQLTTKILGHQETQAIQSDWRPLVYAMRAIAQEEESIRGRKTLLYYSWGIWIPTEQVDTLQNLQSTLARAHVSVYPVYVAGLSNWSQADNTRETLNNAIKDSNDTGKISGGTNTGGRTIENAEGAMRSNGLQTMIEFAKGTSGMILGETNDYRRPMQQVTEDINNYYEVSYVPVNSKLDGTYRKVNLKIPRAKTILSRTGYLAIPAGAQVSLAPAMLPYETAMMEILNQPAAPHAFDFRVKVPRFEYQNGKQHFAFLLEVPFANFTLTPDAKAKLVRASIGVMAVIKDVDGKMVEKLSQFLPFQNPIDRTETLKKINFVFNKEFFLPPGKYSIESIVLDKTANASSTLKTPLEVAVGDPGLRLSSLQVIKRADQVSDSDTQNPYRVGTQKLNPYVEDPAPIKIGDGLMLYYVVYPDQKIVDKPKMKLQVSQGGTPLAEIPAELPAPDAMGRILFTATLPTNAFPPGVYDFKAIVSQGSTTQETKAAVNITQ